MITLGLDTSTDRGGVALWREGGGSAELMMDLPLRHAEELLPLIARLLDRCGSERGQIELVSVNQGPGSFTGLRIGLATAKGICQGLGVPLVGVDGTLVYRSRLDEEKRVCVLLQNRRDLCYARWFAGMKPLGGVEVLSETAVLDRISQDEKDLWVIGNALGSLREKLEVFPLVKLASADLNIPSPMWVARLGEENYVRDRLYDLEPSYVEPVLARSIS